VHLAGERVHEVVFGDEARTDQDFAQAAAGLLLVLQRLVDL